MMPAETGQEFLYLYENDPDSLVMLRKFQKIIPKMFQTAENVIIWVQSYGDQKHILHLQSQFQIQIRCFPTFQHLLRSTQLQNSPKKYILVYPPYLLRPHLPRINITKQIHYPCPPPQQDNQSQSSSSSSSSLPHPQPHPQSHLSPTPAHNLPHLLKILKNWKKSQLIHKQLSNFVYMKDDVWVSNVLIKTMFAMIKKPGDQSVRREIVRNLGLFLGRVCEMNVLYGKYREDIQGFVEELGKQLPINRAIYWYTMQSPIYKFINNLLRSARHPSQIYYIQPYFKDLFTTIKHLFQQQLQSPSHSLSLPTTPTKTYRGGTMSPQQLSKILQNIGSTILNLGFLSTSQNYQIAMSYAKNVLFQIEVCFGKDLGGSQNGFARLDRNSQYYGEEEVLFNPLNSFKILEVVVREEDGEGMGEFYVVKLRYGQFDRIAQQKMEGLSQQEKSIKILGKMNEDLKQSIFCQGNALVNKGQSIEGGIQYWRQYCNVAKGYRQKIKGLLELGLCCKHNGSYLQGENYLWSRFKAIQINYEYLKKKHKECPTQISKKQMDEQAIELAGTLMSLGSVQFQMQKYQNAIVCFQKRRKIILKVLGKNNLKYITTLNNLAISHENLGNFHSCINFYSQNQQIMMKQSFPSSPNCTLLQHQYYDPDYLSSLHNLAIFLIKTNNLAKSLKLLQKCQQLQYNIQGEYHPNYCDTLNSLAIGYEYLGRVDVAVRIYWRCCGILGKVFGRDSCRFGDSLGCLAGGFGGLGDYWVAVGLYWRCRGICLRNSQHRKMRYVAILLNLAHALKKIQLFNRAYQIYKQLYQISQICKSEITNPTKSSKSHSHSHSHSNPSSKLLQPQSQSQPQPQQPQHPQFLEQHQIKKLINFSIISSGNLHEHCHRRMEKVIRMILRQRDKKRGRKCVIDFMCI